MAMSPSVEMMAVSLTKGTTIYFEETAKKILKILHHPSFNLEELKLNVTSLEVLSEGHCAFSKQEQILHHH